MKAVVALGSNLGSCKENLNIAINHLHLILDNLIVSPYTQTKPVGGPKQDDFINAVAVGQCQLSAVDLLTKLLSIEEQMGLSLIHI